MPRLGITALLLPVVFAAAVPPPSRVSVLVVSESGVDAYTEAMGGVAAALPAGSFRMVDAGSKTFESDLASALESNLSPVVIALGSRALAAVRARHTAARPVVSAMVLRGGDAEPAIRRIELDIPLAAQLAAMRSLWPGRTRAGILRNPARSRYSPEALEALARKEGFSLVVVDCEGPAHLLKGLDALQGKVDFVLCLPDPDLYNSVTVKPLVLESLEHRLPLVGFSPAFVRAGAAAGIFPDYADMGRQSAELALRLARGDDRGADDESPRKIRVAINQRVARLLGVDFHPDTLAAEIYR